MIKLKQYLTESSLSRIWNYVENDAKSFGVMSAYRANSPDNNNNHKLLKDMIREYGYGFIEMRGGYKEEEGGFVNEKSLFIPNIDKKRLIELGNKFDQDSVLFKDKNSFVSLGTNKSTGVGKIIVNFKSGKGRENIDLAKEAIKDFFSSLMKRSHSGKKFVFKLQERKEYNHIERMGGLEPYWFDVI